MVKTTIDVNIPHRNIPNIMSEFLDLVGGEQIALKAFSKKHRFFKTVNYCIAHKDEDWTKINRPSFLYRDLDDINNIVILKPVLDKFRRGRPVNLLLRADMINSLCVEAMLAVQYLKRGYLIRWLSAFAEDPPDIRVHSKANKVTIDIEVKTRDGKSDIRSMFNSFSKGYQSLKARKNKKTNPAIVVIHNTEDLGWANWLKDKDVAKRLRTRLESDNYKLVSGVIFLGGSIIKKTNKTQQYGIQYVAFRSNVASYPLPPGFLTSTI